MRYDVSLLQIATDEECFLFRLNTIGLTKSLIGLLEDPSILKVGLSLKDDLSALNRRETFTPASFVELQRLCGGYGIRELTEDICHHICREDEQGTAYEQLGGQGT